MRKYTFIGILILMAGLGAACEDQLNALPGQSKVEGNVILDQKTAEVALNGVYYRFADGGDDRGTPLLNVGISAKSLRFYTVYSYCYWFCCYGGKLFPDG